MIVLVPQNVRLWRIPPCQDYESLCEIQVSKKEGEDQKMNYLFRMSLLQMCGALQNYSPTRIHLLGVVVPAGIHQLERLAKLLLPKSALVGT